MLVRNAGCALRLAAKRCLSTAPLKALPTIAEAQTMPRHVSQMSGDHLYLMVCSASGQPKAAAVRERLRREIMAVDNIEYSETSEKLLEMSAAVQSNQAVIKAPYQAGIYTALFSGWASLPLVFHYGTASVFNDYFVTADPPEVGDADTWLEVRPPPRPPPPPRSTVPCLQGCNTV